MVHGTYTGAKINSFSNVKKYEELLYCHWRIIRFFDGKLSYGEIRKLCVWGGEGDASIYKENYIKIIIACNVYFIITDFV